MLQVENQPPSLRPKLRWSNRRSFFALCACLIVLHLSIATYLSDEDDGGSRSRVKIKGIRIRPKAHRNLMEVVLPEEHDNDPAADVSCKSLNLTKGMILIRGGTVYTPDNIGKMDVLIAGGKILKLFHPDDPNVERLASSPLTLVLNATGAAVTPGLVDIHVHVTGGGGEAGPASRVPEASLSRLLRGGLTTVVGVLGMDSITRSTDVLVAKVAALNRGPVSAFMWTGAYGVLPEVPTVTGSIQRDLALIGPCVGVKIAIADHRASQAGPEVLRAIAAQAQVGGMVGGKAGLVYAHIGAHPDGLASLWDIVRHTATPARQLLPTHMGRTDALVRDGVAWALAGGAVDVSANSRAPAAVEAYWEAGVSPDAVSVSSDAYGSLPKFDEQKRLVAYSYARPDRLLRFVRAMAGGRGWPLARVLALATRNPARRVGLEGKGVLEEGGHADVLVLYGRGLRLGYVIAKGEIALAAPSAAREEGVPAPPHSAGPGCVDRDMFE